MQPSAFLLRTARILFPSLKPTLSLSTASRAFSVLSAQTLRRPAIVQKWVGQGSESGVKVVAEQTRGMVVRSSVKKMCPGCKVCFDGTFSFCDRGEIWSESMFREGWGEEGRVQVVVIVDGTGLRSVLRSAAGVKQYTSAVEAVGYEGMELVLTLLLVRSAKRWQVGKGQGVHHLLVEPQAQAATREIDALGRTFVNTANRSTESEEGSGLQAVSSDCGGGRHMARTFRRRRICHINVNHL